MSGKTFHFRSHVETQLVYYVLINVAWYYSQECALSFYMYNIYQSQKLACNLPGGSSLLSYIWEPHWLEGERGGSVVACRTPEREVGGSWARHFTPRKYWLITQEAMAPSRHDWKIVDWDVKPQHKQTKQTLAWHQSSGLITWIRDWLKMQARTWDLGHVILAISALHFFNTQAPRWSGPKALLGLWQSREAFWPHWVYWYILYIWVWAWSF